tara:strand:- start:801 stop:2108 length:1308 start_codon:yes stop_codon:yes gene_type:complete
MNNISYWDTLEGKLKKAEMIKNGTWKDRNKGEAWYNRIGEFFDDWGTLWDAGTSGSGAGTDYTLTPQIDKRIIKKIKDEKGVDLTDHNEAVVKKSNTCPKGFHKGPNGECIPDKVEKKVEPWKNPWEKNLIKNGRRGPNQRMPSDLRYPYSTIDGTQDFLKFSVFEYKRSYRTALQLSKRNKTAFISSGKESLSQEQGNLRDTRDLLGNIILPIPAQLADTNSTAWGESRMNQLESSLYGAAVGGIQGQGEEVRQSFQDALGTLSANQNMVASYFAKQAVNSLIGGNITLDQLMARNQGEIINPNLELLFSGPTLRNFTFNFKLTPRYEKESQIIRTIIKSFKRNMAPKGSGGTVLRTPNVFQIEYMGKAKDYLNRMKICALKNVAVNYTGDGTFATYQDGAPISSMLTLSFTELTPIYNEDYAAYDNNEDGVGF